MDSVFLWVETQLFALQDPGYRVFHSRLVPTLPPEQIIGVRTPALRALARELEKRPDVDEFLAALPHRYYEQNNLHALLLERKTDISELIAALDRFLPYVDNWATCDLLRPKCFQKHFPELVAQVQNWLRSEHSYTVRFAIEMLMTFGLEEQFSPAYPEMVAAVHSDEYYVNMMIAWYFATALAKQPQAIIGYLEDCRLDCWTHNKTIQKAVESRRISDESKAYLKTLRRKS